MRYKFIFGVWWRFLRACNRSANSEISGLLKPLGPETEEKGAKNFVLRNLSFSIW